MAQFFNISLDFLVFGERPAPSGEDDPVGIRTQIRRALIESSDSAGRHADMVARITARLHSEIEQVAEDLVNSSSVSHPVGFVTDSEAIAMETCIRGMKIMTRIFQSDLNDGEPGPFFEVVVENLRATARINTCFMATAVHWRRMLPRFAVWSSRQVCLTSSRD